VEDLTDVVDVAAGFNYCLVLKSDGTVWAWGANRSAIGGYGSLGYGSEETPPRGTIVQTHDLNNVVAIDAGMRHSLALKSDGSEWAWGLNTSGQLGLYSFFNRMAPIRVIGLRDVVAISAGLTHSLAVKSNGTVWTCGDNSFGQIGVGTVSLPYNFHVQVEGLEDVIAVAGGDAHSLALKSDGSIWVWGKNTNGQLGNGTYDDSYVPVRLSGLTNVVDIAAGGQQNFALVKSTPAAATIATTTIQTPTPTPTSTSNGQFSIIWIVVSAIITALVVVLLLLLFIARNKKNS
jgi:alpha-tubulin suppressor-like RCC1 family protein